METYNDRGPLNVDIFLIKTYASTREELSYVVNYFIPSAVDITTPSVNKLSPANVPYISRSSVRPYF